MAIPETSQTDGNNNEAVPNAIRAKENEQHPETNNDEESNVSFGRAQST
jgi:hypothetical protein